MIVGHTIVLDGGFSLLSDFFPPQPDTKHQGMQPMTNDT